MSPCVLLNDREQKIYDRYHAAVAVMHRARAKAGDAQDELICMMHPRLAYATIRLALLLDKTEGYVKQQCRRLRKEGQLRR